jgi:hypothetical protein
MAAAAPLDGAAAAPVVDDFFPFGALPRALALKIFAALPADTRLRCAEVCREWRAMVAERSLWTRLDLSATSGVTHRGWRGRPALLRAAAAKAGGALQALDVYGVLERLLNDDTLREVVAANAGALRELRCLKAQRFPGLTVPQLEALLSAAPLLRVCEAELSSSAAEARRALRNEGVFGPLRLRTACVRLEGDAATHVSLCADVAAHASLTDLTLTDASLDVPEVLRAFVDAALSLPLLRTVKLDGCRLSPASAPALARLLGSGTLTELNIRHAADDALLDAPAAVLLGDALRANATLTSLTLYGTRLWSSHAAAAALLGALTGHASLRTLAINADGHGAHPSLEDRLHAGALLGALIAADSPALTALNVSTCSLSDVGLRPVFEALPRNSHLRTLICAFDLISDAFAADVLLPAVRANSSLHTLITRAFGQPSDAAREAVALVKSRRDAERGGVNT